MADSSTTREKSQTGKLSSRAPEALVATVPSNLPRNLTHLIGREREIQTLRELLLRDDVPLVTLTGLGGAGKTTLALHVAASLLEEFSGGVFFVSLAALTDPNLILDAVAQALNIPEEQNRNLLASLRDFFLGRPILLVLDNLEQLIEGAPQVSALLEINPQLKIIATSREALRLRGEQVLPLASLTEGFAIELFAQHARAIQPDFEIGNDRESILQICRKLDGLPLAIELAVQRIKLFTPSALLARLQTDLGADSPILSLLTSGPRDLPARQRTLRGAIAWSYSLLNESEQRLFRVAALFPAGAEIDSLSQVAAVPESEALELVASLVDKSLLRAAEGAFPRFVVLETLREFAREQSVHLGEHGRDVQKFIEWGAAFARRASEGLKGEAQNVWFQRLDTEHPNVLAALEAALQSQPGSQNWKSAFMMLDDLHRYWMLRSYFHLIEHLVERGRAAMEQYEKAASKKEARSGEFLRMKAGLYSLTGSAAWARGQYSKARDWHRDSLNLFEQLGDETGMAETLNNLAVNLVALGENEEAFLNFQRCVEIHRKIGDRWGEMRVLSNMGMCLLGLGRIEEAHRNFETGLGIAQHLDDQFFISIFLYHMADTLARKKQYEAARNPLERSLEISNALHIPYMQAWCYMLLAQVEMGLSHFDAAAQAIRSGITLCKGLNEIDLQRFLLWGLVSLCVETGKFSAAATLSGSLEAFIHSSRVKPTASEAERSGRDRKRMRSRLAPDQFLAAFEKGRGLNLQSAFDFGLEQCRDLWDINLPAPAPSLLTERELEVLKLIAAGKTNEQISKELVVVLKTVEKHVAGLFRKLEVKNRTEAAAWAMKQGIVDDK